MDFRTDPLPSYDDIISGNFRNKPSKNKENSGNDIKNGIGSTGVNLKNENIEFKYKNVNKITDEEAEDGELLSEEEEQVKEEKNQNKKSNSINNNNITKSNVKVQKPTSQKHQKGRDFTSNTTNPPTQKFVPRLVCRYFMEGICSKGDKCTFSHAVVPNKTPEEARVKEPCKFFIMGSCMKGDTCYYSHDLSVVPCKFFHLKGECATVSKGGQCRFSHGPIDKETLEKLRQAENERIKTKESEVDTLKQSNAADKGNSLIFIPNLDSSTTNEKSQTRKETETSTDCPHGNFALNLDLMNPFAGDDNDDY